MYIEGFASKLKHVRKEWGFTQRYIEEELKIKQPTLACYESGKRQPDLETLGRLADFYGVSIDWLLGTKGSSEQTITNNRTESRTNGKWGG